MAKPKKKSDLVIKILSLFTLLSIIALTSCIAGCKYNSTSSGISGQNNPNGIYIQILLGILIILIIEYILIWYIRLTYFYKIDELADNMQQYIKTRDQETAEKIRKNAKGTGKVAAISKAASDMIAMMDNHENDLKKAISKLSSAKEQFHAIRDQANRDSLTGVANKTAYTNDIKLIEAKLIAGETAFGIAMIDLNFLKKMNDTYGHEAGNAAIKNICKVICDVFRHSPIYRIGGDEFVVILRNRDYQNVQNLIQIFNRELKKLQEDDSLEPWEKVSAAIGFAKYDPELDKGDTESTFKRADEAMYARKMEMKAVRTD